MGVILISLRTTLVLGYVYLLESAPAHSQSFAPYQLDFQANSETETTGSITLKCRDIFTADFLDVSAARFYLNYSSPADPSLRERGDITVVQVGRTGIKFNLTRRLEGYYSCGKREAGSISVRQSLPKSLISLQTIVPVPPSLQTRFTAASGERVILPCSIQPGALIQQYSAKWTKDDIIIASSTYPQSVDNSPYEIDRATYSLIIGSVNINDTSTDYQCELSVTNPITNTRQILKQSPQVSFSLKVMDLSVSNPFTDVLQFLELSSSLKMDERLTNATIQQLMSLQCAPPNMMTSMN